MEPITDVEEPAAADLGELLDAGDGAMVTLVAGDTQLVVHRAVLVHRSPTLAATLLHNEAETASSRIAVTGMGGPQLRQLLSCLYTHEAPHLTGKSAEHVAAANKCGAAGSKAAEAGTGDLGSLLDAGEGCVVTLVAGGTRLAAHRAVLAARGAGLLLQGAGAEVSVPEVEGPVLRRLLAYCYTLRAPRMADIALPLLVAADKCGVSGLKAQCERQLAAQLTLENAAATAVLAVRHSCARLAQVAVAFIGGDLQVFATQGWADAVIHHPEDVVEVSRLFGDLPAEGRLSREEKGRKLIQVAEAGAVEELEALLAVGADVRTRDWDGWTALHCAADMGHLEATRRLLAAGAEVDARNADKEMALHLAVKRGHVAVVRLLLATSADLTARALEGYSPLHLAALHRRAEMVALLLEAGADGAAKDDYGKSYEEV